MSNSTKSEATHTQGPWTVITFATPRGPRMRVQRKNGHTFEVRASASGKPSVFRTYRAASRIARGLNEDTATEAALRAKYAHLPPLPALSLPAAIAQATGRAA